ncbi:MAG: aldehyde ferredoxin oxidoreductase N-terminal domain-containing protein [Chloroflexota bacterium]|nr:aldehyde ferredoxin oxidoreductase N-terminal domain-containing protein [Chloroflexota bacterium]
MATGGYAGDIVKVDLSSGSITKVPTKTYSDLFLGGRGIAAKIYWDEVPPQSDASNPDNRLIFMTGPVCGVPGFGSRLQVCGKSIATNQFSHCSLGGSWGAHLKRAGYDGVVVHGKADKPVYIWADNGTVEIRDASHLEGMTGFSREEALQNELGESVRVLTVGPAGDNMVSFATFLAADDSVGAGRIAGVMGTKNLIAIAVRGNKKLDIADREGLLKIRNRINQIGNTFAESMLSLGMPVPAVEAKTTLCHGCSSNCMRTTYVKPNGSERKFMCQAAMLYDTRAQRYYGGVTDVPVRATELCDDYGLDTRSLETMIMWLSRCHRAGLLTDEGTAIPLSQIGSYEFIETLIRKISLREGYGDTLARGTHAAAAALGSEAQSLIKDYMTSTGDNEIYGPRLYLTNAIIYAVEPRFAIQHLHETSFPAMMWATRAMGMNDVPVTSEVIRVMAKRFFGSEMAVDFSTYEGKALAAVMIQHREYAKESLILCDMAWPILFASDSPDQVGDPTLESQICAAVTGYDIDEEGLYRIGERIVNLQRAILVREGHRGREYDSIDEFNFSTPLKGDFGNPDCLVPGKDGVSFSRRGMVVDRDEFEKMKSEYYDIRGWDVPSGLQRRPRLEELGLKDIADRLETEGLLR